MSNVIKASSDYAGVDQPAVIGKIYEELYVDSSGQTVTRYIRCFKADNSAVAAGDVVGRAAADMRAMYSLGEARKAPAGGLSKPKVYGVAIAAVPQNSYGFVVCRGICNVAAKTGVAAGASLKTHSVAGQVDTYSAGAGTSSQIIGIALAAESSNSLEAYIDCL